ncbi:hypothetical protein M6D81_12870 [Paenibacillus sp. J5C_2022]|uniref:hypothetical protein n=1 Tax=Paenibacillus sp. J5C2022 TaxID=2977129 RepID=UPI0021D22A25|nr:hypothetical protein [Paenibacillus sp. J5C2022]MCU6709594.1 hypothetical protein [Paenibacillus sp. J5C2022]
MNKSDRADMPKIRIMEPAATMPEWALLQRSLMTLMNDSVHLLLDNYLTPEGEYFWPDIEDFQTYAYSNVDNAFESFHSWPLFYLLGGSSRFLSLAHRQHDVLLRQFSRLKKKDLGIDEAYAALTGRDTLIVNEYLPDIDWMHQGEAAQLFYLLNLADPDHESNRVRSLKFAAFCTNEDDSLPEPNYDPVNRVFRSSLIGSNGPAFCKFDRPYGYSSWMEPYGLAFHDVPGVRTPHDLKDPDKADRYGEVYGRRMRNADTVTNLMATSMVLNAYLHTGEEKYRRWVLDYIEGWRERYAVSGEIMPDNAGPSGIVGETMDGKWYGGHYGWTFPHGFPFIGDALTIAGENERMLTGTEGRLNWVREQLDMLISHAVKDAEGRLLLPQKHGDCGWFEFRTQNPSHAARVYMDTFSDEDKELLFKLRDVTNNTWERISAQFVNGKTMGGQYHAYIHYLNGGYPDYPASALRHSINQVYSQLRKLREELQGDEREWGYPPDNEEQYEELREVTRQINRKYNKRFSESTVHSYFQTFLLYRSTVTTEALVHLTMGGLPPVYNGGLLQVSVRYYDADRGRPGLPDSVSALVSSVQREEITLTLCNLHPYESRRLIAQAGAFGEHQFKSVQWLPEEEEQPMTINGRWFEVELGPGCTGELRIMMNRWTNQPSYATPFQ